ncbi:MAG: transketolase family protein [Erysipelotrichales bacterium]|nr:transketolase family protein [Erysipelotrichales bacterium]
MSEKKLLATRAGYGQGLLDLAEEHDDFVVLEGDLGHATGSLAFGKKYPERYIEAGIAEQNEVGMASGIAYTGWVPFVTSFAIFTAGRACEIVRNAVGFNHMNVKLVGSHSGVTPAADGGTHMCVEDIAWMKAIPEMVVLSPCDYNQTRLLVKKMYEYDGFVYMRTSREPVAQITTMEDDIEIGKAQILREGNDLTIASTGIMTTFVMEAAEILAQEGIECAVLNYHTVKPLDETTLLEYVRKTGNLLTVEEHNVHGGFTESCAGALLGKVGKIRFDHVAVEDRFGETGNRLSLFPVFGLDTESIVRKARNLVRKEE